MPRNLAITTHWTAGEGGENMCNVGRTCPSVHSLADRPGIRYVITTQVTDPDELAAFAELIGPGEVLGTAPAEMFRQPR